MTIEITPTIAIDEDEIEEKFIRAHGPGGQNVNKIETAVQLRFDAVHCPALTRPVFHRLKKIAGQRMTSEGKIILTASRFRSQERNRKDALGRLVEMIRQAAIPPKIRRATKPSRAAKQKRLDSKRQRSSVKNTRGRVNPIKSVDY